MEDAYEHISPLLSQLWESREAAQWMKQPNELLDNRTPNDVANDGRPDLVVAVLRGLLDGAYT